MMITAGYAAALAILFLILSARTLLYRRATQVPLGNGEDRALLRRIRAHGNFSEYTPMALILMVLAEHSLREHGLGFHWVMHLLGVFLVVGRIMHAYGISQIREVFFFRVVGMGLTFNAIAGSALVIVMVGLFTA